MDDIKAYETRIMAALNRVAKGVEAMATPPAAQDDAGLQLALDAERAKSAQLADRLRSMKDKDAVPTPPTQLEARVDKMTRQLDVQGLELQRMRKTNIQLREQLRVLREAADTSTVDATLVNKSMQAELDALRATRASEIAEMDEILAELSPLIAEVKSDA
jgi:hypothetical protein